MLYWLKICPFCNQGRLFIYKNLNQNKLYLHCEECERGYKNLDNVSSETSFLTLLEDFDSIEADLNDLMKENITNFNEG
jgi:hypothetical protein